MEHSALSLDLSFVGAELLVHASTDLRALEEGTQTPALVAKIVVCANGLRWSVCFPHLQSPFPLRALVLSLFEPKISQLLPF